MTLSGFIFFFFLMLKSSKPTLMWRKIYKSSSRTARSWDWLCVGMTRPVIDTRRDVSLWYISLCLRAEALASSRPKMWAAFTLITQHNWQYVTFWGAIRAQARRSFLHSHPMFISAWTNQVWLMSHRLACYFTNVAVFIKVPSMK